ncbi:MAG: hypothetical protein ACLSDQ_00640 [Adlercreutzia equolifaciens]
MGKYTRRQFITSAGVGIAAVAGLGLAGCAPQTPADKAMANTGNGEPPSPTPSLGTASTTSSSSASAVPVPCPPATPPTPARRCCSSIRPLRAWRAATRASAARSS